MWKHTWTSHITYSSQARIERCFPALNVRQHQYFWVRKLGSCRPQWNVQQQKWLFHRLVSSELIVVALPGPSCMCSTAPLPAKSSDEVHCPPWVRDGCTIGCWNKTFYRAFVINPWKRSIVLISPSSIQPGLTPVPGLLFLNGQGIRLWDIQYSCQQLVHS